MAELTSRSFKEFRDSGLLWLVNKTVFHPRGFALCLFVDQETGEVSGWDLIGDGEESWTFSDTMDEDEHFRNVKRLLEETAEREKEENNE